MGKNNRSRRAAKARSKAKARSRRGRGAPPFGSGWGTGAPSGSGWRPPPQGEPIFTQAETARNLLVLAAMEHRGDRWQTDAIDGLAAMPATLVYREVETVLLDQVDVLWAGGWQPAELNRQGRLGCPTAAGGRLVSLAISADHAGRRSATVDQRWVAQVEGLDLPAVNGRPGWVSRWADDEGFDRRQTVSTVVDALANLLHLPRLDPILPPPGSGTAATDGAGRNSAAGAAADPVLDRIRSLLAKAESTTFEAEATALTAKAQELMTRHAIDAALVHGNATAGSQQPVALRIPVDPPYVDAKSLLLQTVAESGRCRAVFHTKLAMSTVVGFPADVAAVELLFTSLLVQAQSALAEAARRAPAGTRTRSQPYRSAFLLSYTERIGDRLREINEAVFAEVESEHGSSFLPVLRSRSATIDDYMQEKFGELASSRVRGGYDAAGWAGGRVAADNAQLRFGDLPDEVVTPA
ncbi:MAG: DUF2786 domain-containing protein [Actinobacteria bacterium]|nr:MAG: DUF2786 domain-containing protein [Actinomycetota bacterium]